MDQKCLRCKRKLVPIGSARKNGANHKDWNTRKYHKGCYKIIELLERVNRYLK